MISMAMDRKGKFVFKGIIRGTFSQHQALLEEAKAPAIMTFVGKTLTEAVSGLALLEWMYVLKVNNRRIVNPERYLKRKGIWKDCIR
jgi:hypothetical protein